MTIFTPNAPVHRNSMHVQGTETSVPDFMANQMGDSPHRE